MDDRSRLVQQARTLTKAARKEILQSYPEPELHVHLHSLLSRMATSATIEVTHGSQEFGKDLVMVRNDAFGQTVIGIVVERGDIRAQTKPTFRTARGEYVGNYEREGGGRM